MRHFAVLQPVRRGRWGSVWLVKDRRNSERNQLLFVPSRLRAWPLWLRRLESLDATPVRLRQGRVAILITSTDATDVLQLIRKSNRSGVSVLNAMAGFEAKVPTKKTLLWILPVIAVFPVLFLALAPSQLPVSKRIPVSKVETSASSSCSGSLSVGSEVVGALGRYEKLSIDGEKFVIASFTKVGGLVQIKTKRLCDQKYFRFNSWIREGKLRVERIY